MSGRWVPRRRLALAWLIVLVVAVFPFAWVW
jgi:hypothetical protein